MNNSKFIYTITMVQNFPRWDEYAPKFEDNTASHSYRVAMYGLLASLVENYIFQENINVLKVMGRGIFHDINESKTGPIKHETKKDPEVIDQIKRLEKEASEEVLSYLSKSLQPIFEDFIVNAEDMTKEGRLVDAIDTFDALMFCHRESLNSSSKFFHEKYDELREKLFHSKIKSVKWMVDQVDKRNEFYDFLMSILNLDTVSRWKGKANLVPDNDAIHTFRATALAIFNSYLEIEKFNKNIDVKRVVAKVLCHDLVEEYTGDVLGPVKHSTPETKHAFEQYEKKAAMRMVELLPEELHEVFIDYMVEAKSEDYEGTMVDIVDKLDALIKTNMERKNNIAYEFQYRKQLKKIQQKFDNPSVIFFLAYPLHDLSFAMFDDI